MEADLIRLTERRDVSEFCESLLGCVCISSAALAHGKIKEPEALRALENVREIASMI